MTSFSLRFCVSLGLVAALGCAPPPPAVPPPAPTYLGELRAPSAYPGAFMDEQKVTASFGDKSASFAAVVQKQDDTLLLLGRTPFGSRAFLLKQTGADFTFEKYIDRELPFSPRYMLLDVHRMLLRGLAPPGEALPDGKHEGIIDAESVTERWVGERLLERRFRAPANEPPGEIVITYEGGMGKDRAPPKRVTLDNGFFGYRLVILTDSHRAL